MPTTYNEIEIGAYRCHPGPVPRLDPLRSGLLLRRPVQGAEDGAGGGGGPGEAQGRSGGVRGGGQGIRKRGNKIFHIQVLYLKQTLVGSNNANCTKYGALNVNVNMI